MNEDAKRYYERLFPGGVPSLQETDPEFVEFFGNFAFDEVLVQTKLDDETRMMAILASLMGCQGLDEFKIMAEGALNLGVSPIVIKEVVYQGAAFLGIGRAFPFLHVTNEVMKKCGISLPLEGQSATNPENRLEMGRETQVGLFGEHTRDAYKSGPEESRHINRWLTANCFGDYYTRKPLDYAQREMITFCFLAAQGGCEPQLMGHSMANMRLGNSKEFMIDVLSQCMPYIGYPRTLNALRVLNEAAYAVNEKEQ